MPRRPRSYLPGVPCHVVQRGNNRGSCFLHDSDRIKYLAWLLHASRKYDCAIHAWVLMTNHAHFLVTPCDTVGISRMMQSLGRRYVQYFNWAHERTGTLWEGRHHGSLVDSDTYFLVCSRYIELNPVRAGIVAHPSDYRWSSYAANAHGRPDALVQHHEVYSALGDTGQARQRAYRELFSEDIPEAQLQNIRDGSRFGLPVGAEGFKQALDRRLPRPVSYRHRGRPAKK